MKIRKYYDPATETKGGSTDIIIKSIEDLGKKHAESIDGVKKELGASIDGVKAEVKAVKDEADKRQQELDEKMAKLGTQLGPKEEKSFNQILSSVIEENTDNIAKFARKETKSLILDLKAVGDMTLTGNYSGGSVFTNDAGRTGIIQNANRKLHIRDIPELVKGTMTGNAFPYLKENGAGEGSITTVAEAGTKPQIDFDLVEALAPAQVIAGFAVITRQMMDDVPGLIAFLQARLMEALLTAEDNQLINGDGTSPNISGITDTGNFTAAAGAATVDIEQLVQAISQLEELNREANAILLRPSDYWNIMLNKSAGSGEYDLPGIITSQNGLLRIAGVPVYRTTAMTVDKFIVGDFRNGAMLLQRQAPVIEFFEQDSTNVRTNKVTVRIEERVAFPIFGSNYFIYGDLGNVA